MLVVALHILGFIANMIAKLPDSITVRKFSLLTSKGENVFHKQFSRRRLAESSVDKLIFKFTVSKKKFKFEFERRYSIFAPGATIKMTGRVS